MHKEHTRVLGRTLAVEEMKDVSGAKPTLPRFDQITDPSAGDLRIATQDEAFLSGDRKTF